MLSDLRRRPRFGADHLSVKLLKHNGDYAEYKSVGGAYYQEQNSAYHRADYRTEHGNEIKNAYHNGDKLRIFYAENKQEDIVQYAYNSGIEYFSGDISAEYVVGFPHYGDKVSRFRFRQEGIRYFFCLIYKSAFAVEQIY